MYRAWLGPGDFQRCASNWEIGGCTCQKSSLVTIQRETSSFAGFPYLAIASRNRLLYSLGLVTVGLFRPPPANPRFLIQLSSCLSHV